MGSTILLACLIAIPNQPQAGAAAGLQRFQRTEPHMGTTFGIVFYAPDESAANEAFEAAFARIAQLNRVCSDYDPDSELSRLSARSPTAVPVPVSQDLCRVLGVSLELSDRTGGAFDVTIGPVSRLWRQARLQHRPPDAARRREAMAAVGYRNLVLDRDACTVELKQPHMRLDLGAIAKGYAVDEALLVLWNRGITRALVNAGGNLAAGDPPPGDAAWRIDIGPLEAGGETGPGIGLTRAAVSTSGDAFQFLELDGKRYSHILDPRTGTALTGRSRVTVIAATGMLADGLSTAVSVLGAARGLELIEATEGAAAYVVAIEEERRVTHVSRHFGNYVRPPLARD